MKVKSFLMVTCLVLVANFSFAGTNVESSKINVLAKPTKAIETSKAEKSKPKRCVTVTLSCGIGMTVCGTSSMEELLGIVRALEALNCRGRG